MSFTAALQETLATTRVHELTQSRLLRLAAALETKLDGLQASLDHRQQEYERVKAALASSQRRLVATEARLVDAAEHRDSLARVLEEYQRGAGVAK